MAKKGKADKKGKKGHKNKPSSKRYSKYKIDGDKIERTERFCPRCGPGIFLMSAKNRFYCGKCHYSEFQTGSDKDKDKNPDKKEESKPEKKE